MIFYQSVIHIILPQVIECLNQWQQRATSTSSSTSTLTSTSTSPSPSILTSLWTSNCRKTSWCPTWHVAPPPAPCLALSPWGLRSASLRVEKFYLISFQRGFVSIWKRWLLWSPIILPCAIAALTVIPEWMLLLKAVKNHLWQLFNRNLGKGEATKSDEFSEKFQRGGGAHFQSKNICCRFWEL